MKDFVDAHVDLWAGELDDLDRDVEGITVRLQVLTRYLERRREAVLAAYGLQLWEFKTLHMLRRGGTPYRATPGELARQLGMSPAALTNRLDALEGPGELGTPVAAMFQVSRRSVTTSTARPTSTRSASCCSRC